MAYEIKEIKKGIKVHCINTNKFKTNLFAAFLRVRFSIIPFICGIFFFI